MRSSDDQRQLAEDRGKAQSQSRLGGELVTTSEVRVEAGRPLVTTGGEKPELVATHELPRGEASTFGVDGEGWESVQPSFNRNARSKPSRGGPQAVRGP